MKRKDVDILLLKEARNGSDKAFSSLFSYYHSHVFNYIRLYVSNYTDVEDLTMITFEKAFANVTKFIPLFEFKTWLFKIARNTSLDFIIHKKRLPVNVILNEANDYKCEIEYSEEKYIILERSIKQLDERFRNVIELYYYENCSYKEISSKLHLSINTVCVHILRAKRYLHKSLIKKLVS